MQYFYHVQSGDTLYGIARRWGLPLESLIAANNLRPPYTIFIGQQLAVPPGVNSVRVKPGDTVYKISQAFRIPTSDYYRSKPTSASISHYRGTTIRSSPRRTLLCSPAW